MFDRRFSAPRPFLRRGVAPVLVLVVLIAVVGATTPTQACDICAIYTATEMQQSRTGLRLGVAQQISQFSDLQLDGRSVANPANEHLTSAITQLIAGFNPTSKFGIQLSLPWIRREYRRGVANAIESGHETGIGDLSLLASYTAFARTQESGVFRLTALGGVKLPSGSAARLREDLPKPLDPNDVRDRLNENFGLGRARFASVQQAHLGPDGASLSGIHGHDLSLGTGSTDPVVGGQLLWTWRRVVLASQAQAVIRTKGRHGYEYADELTASVHPGVFALLDHRQSLVVHLASTFEAKGKDRLGGRIVPDTALTALYLGPGLHYTRGSALSFDFALDLPVYLDNSALQIVPEFRLRAGLMWRL